MKEKPPASHRAQGRVGKHTTNVFHDDSVLPISFDSSQIVQIDTDQITVPGTGRVLNVTYYRNPAYKCSVEGFKTYAVIEPNGVATDAPAYVYLRGGSVGHWLSGATQNDPGAGYAGGVSKLYEDTLLECIDNVGNYLAASNEDQFMGKLFDRGWRIITFDYGNHDGYMGIGRKDPNNPFYIPTTGLSSTRASLDHFLRNYSTPYFFIHGTSAGSSGVWSLAMQLVAEGPTTPLAGIIPDAHWNSDSISAFYAGNAVPEVDSGKTYAQLNARMSPVGGANPERYMENIIGDPRWNIPIFIPYMTNDHQCGGGALPVQEALDAGFNNNCDWNLSPIVAAIKSRKSRLYRYMRIDTSSIVTPVYGSVDTTAHIVLDGKSNAPWQILQPAHVEALDWVDYVVAQNWS